jgi:hypothetical protein
MTRFADPEVQAFARSLAHGRCGAVSERQGARLLWYPAINRERVPCDRAPFLTSGEAKVAAMQFREECRDQLGSVE